MVVVEMGVMKLGLEPVRVELKWYGRRKVLELVKWRLRREFVVSSF